MCLSLREDLVITAGSRGVSTGHTPGAVGRGPCRTGTPRRRWAPGESSEPASPEEGTAMRCRQALPGQRRLGNRFTSPFFASGLVRAFTSMVPIVFCGGPATEDLGLACASVTPTPPQRLRSSSRPPWGPSPADTWFLFSSKILLRRQQ